MTADAQTASMSMEPSRIVLGIGTSHSPLLSFDAETWAVRAQDDLVSKTLNMSDGRYVSYEDLKSERGEPYLSVATIDQFRAQVDDAQAHLDRLADEIEAAAPDVVIIVGDDHGEMYSETNMPAFGIFYGQDIVMHPWGETWKDPPEWFDTAMKGYAMDSPHRFEGAPEVAKHLINGLMDRDVDVTATAKVEDAAKAGLGHAFGFVIQRLFRGRIIPVVPILLNTYFETNVVRPGRCFRLGQLLRDAIADIPGGLRIAVVASGGLSHFVTDEALDQRVLEGLRTKDAVSLSSLPLHALKSGSSEILCWVMAAGALETLDQAWAEYIPVYRTPAGSGVGLGFCAWREASGPR